MLSVKGINISPKSKKTHISNEILRFYVSNNRCRFDVVRKSATDLSQHEALHDAAVRQTTLCVTSGAPLCGTKLRLLTRRSEYVMISLILGTPVPPTAVSVTFGARRRSASLRLLDALSGIRSAKAAHGVRNRSLRPPFRPSTSPRDALRTLLRHAGRVSSVGGSAMHMKWPDGIGREAGIGRTRSGKELNIFRACPWRLALHRVTPSWSKRVGPPLRLLLFCLLYTSPSPRDRTRSRMPSSA